MSDDHASGLATTLLRQRAPQSTATTIITKRFSFDAAHQLPAVAEDHKCRRLHGHTYQVWLHVTGPVLSDYGWVTDFGDIKKAWKPLEKQLDHHLLNEIPGLENPTAEVLAAWIWQELSHADLGSAHIAAVEVAETPDSRALFVPPSKHGIDASVTNGHRANSDPAPVPDEAAPLSFTPVTATAVDRLEPPAAPSKLEDVQERPDGRGIAIDEVGVSRVRVPVEVLDRDRGRQSTVGTLTLGVGLRPDVKGTHLSRFLEALRAHQDALTLFELGSLTTDLRNRLDADDVHARVEFPYFVTKAAPVTGSVGEVDHDCWFDVVHSSTGLRHILGVRAPITTLCPCSRDISDYGAHNQRGWVTIEAELAHEDGQQPYLVWIEELIEIADAASSCPVYPVLKRPDERFVTMRAYDNPRFVEDVVREVALALDEDPRIAGYDIRVENDESIHAHNAFARVVRRREA